MKKKKITVKGEYFPDKCIFSVVTSCLWLFILIIYLMIESDLCVLRLQALYLMNTVKSCTYKNLNFHYENCQKKNKLLQTSLSGFSQLENSCFVQSHKSLIKKCVCKSFSIIRKNMYLCVIY